jgi:hypothetical protein
VLLCIYCGKNLQAKVRILRPSIEAGAAYGVVMKFLNGLEDKGHSIVMDSSFLFHSTL